MLSTKVRTTTVTLIAAFSIGTATIAPAVSSAAKNNHGYAKTVGKKRQWNNTCADAQNTWLGFLDIAKGATAEGDTKGAAEAIASARTVREHANASGCKIGIEKAPPVAQRISVELSQPVS